MNKICNSAQENNYSSQKVIDAAGVKIRERKREGDPTLGIGMAVLNMNAISKQMDIRRIFFGKKIITHVPKSFLVAYENVKKPLNVFDLPT